MPDKPLWCSRLDEAAAGLRSLPDPWVDRATLEQALGVGRRRAQQLLAPCVTRKMGANGLAERENLIRHLRELASGDAVYHERRRRQRLAETLEILIRERREQPRVLVEAPSAVRRVRLEGLPAGIDIVPGRITVDFTTTEEALQRLLALAMAIGNDMDRFEAMTMRQ